MEQHTIYGSTETTCHCGAEFKGSDHCPRCYCEQFEADCGERPKDDAEQRRHDYTEFHESAGELAAEAARSEEGDYC